MGVWSKMNYFFFKSEMYDILIENKLINCDFGDMPENIEEAIRQIFDYSKTFFDPNL